MRGRWQKPDCSRIAEYELQHLIGSIWQVIFSVVADVKLKPLIKWHKFTNLPHVCLQSVAFAALIK
eukprot:SAG31_NODE_30491_length_380_cov_1.060498_1_plen_65_part_10